MPNTFPSKLFLIVILYQVILNEGYGCDADNAGEFRLRGETNIAGLVQICLQEDINGSKEYEWLNVCSDGWGQDETIAVCECQMDICNIGKLLM